MRQAQPLVQYRYFPINTQKHVAVTHSKLYPNIFLERTSKVLNLKYGFEANIFINNALLNMDNIKTVVIYEKECKIKLSSWLTLWVEIFNFMQSVIRVSAP